MTRPRTEEELLVAKTVQAWIGAHLDPPHLDAVEKLIVERKGKLVVQELLAALADDPATAVLAAMPLLESVMAVCPGVAGCLMGRLYPIADERKLHSVFNAIELWMDVGTSVDLAEALERLARESTKPALKVKYREWAEQVRTRARQ